MSSTAALAGVEGIHAVEFYEDDVVLGSRVAEFLGTGLAAGDPVITIATAEHRNGYEQQLAALGHDVAAAVARGQLVVLDAHATLALLVIDGEVSRERFFDVVGGALAGLRAAYPGRPVHAFGEMVDVLWRAGQRSTALALEQLWNELARVHQFSLLCAYAMGNFFKGDDASAFDEVCRLHSHVVGTPEVAKLEQRTRALEHELARRKELETALREALARESTARHAAERMLRFNEQFASMLGHDLRNPLSTISIGAGHIARSTDSDKIGSSAARIVASAERMARMVDQLLALTKLRMNPGVAGTPIPVDLGELWRTIIAELRKAHPASPIVVESLGNLAGQWDKDRLEHVAISLTHNAIVHGTPGRRVTVTLDGNVAKTVVATVHNAGEVAPEVLPVLFAPFREASHKRPNARGLGLGLYLADQIVAAHGGTIDVSSEPHDGTTVRVTLPRQGLVS